MIGSLSPTSRVALAVGATVVAVLLAYAAVAPRAPDWLQNTAMFGSLAAVFLVRPMLRSSLQIAISGPTAPVYPIPAGSLRVIRRAIRGAIAFYLVIVILWLATRQSPPEPTALDTTSSVLAVVEALVGIPAALVIAALSIWGDHALRTPIDEAPHPLLYRIRNRFGTKDEVLRILEENDQHPPGNDA